MIISLGEDGAGCCAGRLLVYPRFVSSCFYALPLGDRGGLQSLIATLPRNVFNCLHMNYKKLRVTFLLQFREVPNLMT